MDRIIKKTYFYIIALLLLASTTAMANTGVPMIFITMPAMLISLISIIAIEAYIYRKHLKLTDIKLLKSSTISNTVSTLIGIPLTWLLLVVIEYHTGGGYAYGY